MKNPRYRQPRKNEEDKQAAIAQFLNNRTVYANIQKNGIKKISVRYIRSRPGQLRRTITVSIAKQRFMRTEKEPLL